MRFSIVVLALAGQICAAAEAADDSRRGPVVRAVERIGPAVVNIWTEQIVEQQAQPFPGFRDPFFDEFFRDFVEPQRQQRRTRTSLGSGVVIREDGYILTNEHVILRGGRIRVTLADEREFEAGLVGTDSDSDLAVLKVEPDRPLPVAPLGDSDDVLIGETVIAIGNPFGLSHTVTTGVVSALGRSLKTDRQTYFDFIQTDASINPGNSGGPLLNIDGDLVGINTAIYQKAQGIGFAIPVNRARRIVDDLIRYGEVHVPWVGAVVQNLSDQLADHFGVRRRRGVLVRTVEDASPAAEAGIVPGDVIVAVGERVVHSADEYEQRIRDHAAEAEIRLRLHREGTDRGLSVRSRAYPPERAETLAWRLVGVRVRQAPRALVVAEVRAGSSAARIGLQPGDVLVALGGTPVATEEALRRRMVEIRNSQSALLSVQRGRRLYRVQIPLG